MKKIAFLLLALPVWLTAGETTYTIKSYNEEGVKAPNTHYLGEAWLSHVLEADDTLDYNITKATFKANSTLDWHKHATPQVLIVVDGEGYYQERGKDPVRTKEGDVIRCEPNVEHWHASSREQDVTYLAIYGGNEPTTWTEVLSREAYDEVAKKLKVE
ncbi:MULTISPECIES: cupin domain-containing protein [unclassified Leeuwenhoekiella]|uniref:cupin domain-containing protein n=1 Tax=unclassified Leeuwenhoekiella TaxID=2615029 RepID=UPI000C42CEB0|nr:MULTISPECIES: cupin domain-containing protein [unclassified Leeuwenhoekiella]MAW96141.1 cupin [Leeuwenhoekiella sp.]MBA80135.1 cupin [Leeuwenhoekiella sp.]|tara:strand:- start:38401 stop:38874 length:474 start_codon:yes stop_codon:yes gene_type:complete